MIQGQPANSADSTESLNADQITAVIRKKSKQAGRAEGRGEEQWASKRYGFEAASCFRDCSTVAGTEFTIGK